jgi:2-oxoglutarate ferredoxin oxidoreductase subunit gamma
MDIVCAGFGGQGVLTLGLILAKTGMDSDMNVTWIPSYGSEMRGGTANCNVKISHKQIASPFIKEIDVLIAMNRPSLDKFHNKVKPNGWILFNKSLIGSYPFSEGINLVEINASEIAEELKNPKGSNIVMLGAFASAKILFEEDTLKRGVQQFFEEKKKDKDQNGFCFEKGIQEALVAKRTN